MNVPASAQPMPRAGESQTSNTSTASSILLTYLHQTIDKSTAEVRANANALYTKIWASNIVGSSQSLTSYEAFVFSTKDATEIQKCKLEINMNAHQAYLELSVQIAENLRKPTKVSVKINARSLKWIRAANASQASRHLLPEQQRLQLEKAVSSESWVAIKRRIKLIEDADVSVSDRVPILMDVAYHTRRTAQERVHIGTPSSAEHFASYLTAEYARVVIAGNDRTIHLLDNFIKICAYQTVNPPTKQWNDHFQSMKGPSKHLSKMSLQDYHFKAAPSFHGLHDYKLVLLMGAKLEDRHRQDMIKRYTANECTLRLVEVANSGKMAYFGFIPLPKEELRINPSTKVGVEFKDVRVGQPLDKWSAKVADAIPFGPSGTLPLLLTRRPVREGRRQQIKDTPVKDISETPLSGERVKIQIDEPDHIIKLKEDAFNLLANPDSEASEQTWSERVCKLLSGQNLNELAAIDMFRAIRNEIQHPEEIMDINSTQRLAVQAAQRAPGGFQFVQGPPGTGKTHYAIEFVKPFLLSKNHHPVLVVSQANRSVDTLARGLQNKLQSLQHAGKVRKSRYVVRLHSKHCEFEIAQSLNPGKRSARLPHFGSADSLHSDAMTDFLRERYLKQTSTKYEGIDDARVQELELSVGWRMLQIAGVIPHPYITEDVSKWPRFRAHHAGQALSDDQSEEDVFYEKSESAQEKLCKETRKLYEYALSKALVVVTTVSNAGSKAVLRAISKDISLIIFDEAGREREDNFLPLFVAEFPKNSGLLTIGDPEQLKPRVECPANLNPFVEQLEMSFLERMIRLGFELFTFTLQYRMVPEISAIPNSLTYQNQLEDADSVQIARRPIAQDFRDFVSRINGAHSNVLFIDMQPCATNATKADHTRSRYNELIIIYICDYLCQLLKTFKKAKIAVLTAYTAQSSRLEIAVNNMVVAEVEGAENIHVGRFEGEQGEQYDIVIIDLLVGRDVGFLSDKRRMNVAVSRARDGLIILADSQCIHDAKGDSSYMCALLEILAQYSVNSGVHDEFPPCPYYHSEASMFQSASSATSDETCVDQAFGEMSLH